MKQDRLQWAIDRGRNGGFPEGKERGEEHETGQASRGKWNRGIPKEADRPVDAA